MHGVKLLSLYDILKHIDNALMDTNSPICNSPICNSPICIQERRITPSEALNHPFVTMAHMADYAHCANVKSSAQKMEICKRSPVTPPHSAAAATLMAAGVRNGNVTLTFNNQLGGRVGAAAAHFQVIDFSFLILIFFNVIYLIF